MPVFQKKFIDRYPPPQTIISVPVHTAVWYDRAEGAPAFDVGAQLSVEGSYRPPVYVSNLFGERPS